LSNLPNTLLGAVEDSVTSFLFIVLLTASLITPVQEPHDSCQISFTDIAAAQRALERALPVETKILGTFETIIGEEVNTTRHFRFPNSNQYVTASVSYTDEVMNVRKPGSSSIHDASISLALVVSGQQPPSANGVEGNAAAETNYDENTLEVRVRKVVRINGRAYVIGLECLCNGATRIP
jgi:hypothetical protein